MRDTRKTKKALIQELNELRRNEQRFREFAELLPQAACETDGEGNFVFVNKNALQSFGYTQEDLQAGVNVGDTIAPEDRPRLRANVQRVLAGQGGARPNEYTMLRRDGSTFPALVYSSPIMRDGQAVGLRYIVVDISELRQATQALRETNEYLENLFNYANAPIIVWDPQLKITWFNRACESLTGRKAADVIGASVETLFSAGTAASSMDLIERTRGGERWETVEIDVLHVDGSVRTVLWNSATLVAEDGKTPTATIAQGQDITERKRAEEAVRDSELRLRELIDRLPQLVWTCVPEGPCDYLSRQWAEYTGIPEAGQLGYRWLDQLHPEDREATITTWNETVGKGASRFDTEFRIRGADGVYRWFKTQAVPLRDSAGNIVKWFGSNTDIDDLKRAEDAVRKSEMLYRSLVEHLPQRIFVKDRNSAYLSCNANYARDLGIAPEEIVGKDDSAFHPRELAEAYRADDRAVMETDTPRDIEEHYQVAGQTQWVHTVKVPYHDQQGRVVGVLGVFEDITERRQSEEQFRQSQKMEAIGRLAGGVAHDLNNLLTGIRGCAEFALEEAEPASQAHQDLTEVLALADRAADLTGQLLAFSRRQPLQPIVFEVNSLIADSVKMLTRLLREDVDLQFIPAEDAGNVRADPNHIGQILMNLAVNARDAMPDGGRLSIETARVELGDDYARSHVGVTPGPYVMVALSDTGCGMDAETREHMFDPFFTTKEQGRGTGLGLPTVYGIVKQHDGHVWVYSEPGKGTTVKVYLPRVAGPVEERAPKSAFVSGGTETILLVEDNDAVRDVGRRHLEALGYTVLCAADAREAEAVADEHGEAVDLLLTDVVMPDRNGRELYEALAPRHPDLKVLYMSGYTDDAIVHHGVLLRGIPFLQKPFERNSLADKVRQALDR